MTTKWEDLESFMEWVWRARQKRGEDTCEIGISELEMYIRKKFGVTRFVVKNIMTALRDCGMIQSGNESGWVKMIYNKEKDAKISEAEKEVEEYERLKAD